MLENAVIEEELLARMDAVMRRSSNVQEKALGFKGIKLDEKAYLAKYKNQQIPMTKKEFSLLSLFLKKPNL